MKRSFLPFVFALCLAPALAGAQVVIHLGPPAPVHEVAPPPPHPGWVWQPGYHRWDGARYVWVPGTYAAPPHPGAHWIAGHWDKRNGGYVWTDGRWK